MRAVVVAPYHTSIRGQTLPAVTRDKKIGLAVTQRGDSGVYAETFFDDGKSVWELVEERRF